ncbi:hypothetical protein U0070_023720 [Myodes glareolus]|uniref:Uncharacterized protein n=1 Tax=Myodes glareolus TaxID=447135 RepID=A0AAW0GYS3_MYOGA
MFDIVCSTTWANKDRCCELPGLRDEEACPDLPRSCSCSETNEVALGPAGPPGGPGLRGPKGQQGEQGPKVTRLSPLTITLELDVTSFTLVIDSVLMRL